MFWNPDAAADREFAATAFSASHVIAARHGLHLRPGQLRCAQFLTGPCIVELATGEGKTAAILPAALFQAQRGRRVWVATANDYLAQRDAGFASLVYGEFGLNTGCVTAGQSRTARRNAYGAEIVYGTIREFVFDHLRDRLAQSDTARGQSTETSPLQRSRDVLICDEADSLLIDEALTPCIISAAGEQLSAGMRAGLRWATGVCETLELDRDFVDHPELGPVLTPTGRSRFIRCPMPEDIAELTLTDLEHCLELSLLARRSFREGEQYVVQQGKVKLVDESTGRIGEGRAWSRGLQQAVEAREQVPLTVPTEHAAALTIQQFVRGFSHVSGLTGTARECSAELREVYGLRVRSIPEHVPSQRVKQPQKAFVSAGEKLNVIAQDVRSQLEHGRSVLIGTRTVRASEEVSGELHRKRIPHVVLNARQPQKESLIVSRAGLPGQVTVATNMAGRGTDIPLHPDVRARGGLHVIGTELHSSARIDRQLMGRCGRQGDPGSFRQYVSLEDDIFHLACGVARGSTSIFSRRNPGSPAAIIRAARRAQQQMERAQRSMRQELCRRREEEFAMLRSLGVDPVVNPLPEN